MSVNDTHSWDTAVRRQPCAITVAQVIDEYGYEAAQERWGWLTVRTLSSLAHQGRKQLERRDGP
ncbi:hypothetical protein ASD04_07035 [Devosia sp. Root436]|uniref:hypothetical protein n=1 Tax=Devosia sp. Root436 TaxID=1736537 RepID=UPI0006FE1F67|nr:hypothetical protein [Devosia sp. Root436]KQX40377.1 hypothetical protein ASD04_07035 [Devosia sp. Root436]